MKTQNQIDRIKYAMNTIYDNAKLCKAGKNGRPINDIPFLADILKTPNNKREFLEGIITGFDMQGLNLFTSLDFIGYAISSESEEKTIDSILDTFQAMQESVTAYSVL